VTEMVASAVSDVSVRRQLGDLRQCAEALGVGLP